MREIRGVPVAAARAALEFELRMMKPFSFGLFGPLGLLLLATACSQAGTQGTPVNSGNSSDGSSAQGPGAPGGAGGGGAGNTSGGGHRNAGGGSLIDTLDASDRARTEDEVDTFAAMVGGSTALRYRGGLVPGYTNLYQYEINNTGSGWKEKFLLQPPLNVGAPAPMLVVFHKFGVGQGDVINTNFLAEGEARGWFVLAPLGARQNHFGNFESQINEKAAINLVCHLYQNHVDLSRVYGVGFSMGGGALSNYAARHVDPAGVMFAAICDHTGSVSLTNVYYNEPNYNDPNDAPHILESLYGGPPSLQPFNYVRCSSIDLDWMTNIIDPNTDFARNLAHVPTLCWLATNDPIAYLYNQTTMFAGHIQPLNANDALNFVSANVHMWTTLDDHYVCDWLAQFSLLVPTSGSSLADEDGQWFRFTIEQDTAGAFTPFTWSIAAAQKLVTLSATKNLRRVSLDSANVGFAFSGAVTLDLSTADTTGDQILLRGVNAAPISVQRDGAAAGGTYDALGHTFQIVETDGAPHHWVLTFP